MTTSRARKTASAIALVAAGAVAGGVLASSLTATAAESPTPSPSARPAHPPRADETPLTGDTLAKVKAAVLKKYPGASFDRVETDSDGVYEAHITKADGTRVTVELDKAFAITGEEQGREGRGRHGGPGGPGGRGPHAGETPLTGDALAKVKAAVLKAYPGATVDRAETDSDGAYEAHITKADGTRVTVELDKAFAVTGEEQHRGPGPRGAAPAPSESPKTS